MNINEMSMDQATDAMLRISNALGFILEDEEVTALLDDLGKSESSSPMMWIPKYLPRIANAALRRHKDDVYEIIGALSQQDKKAVGKMNFLQAVALLKENWETLTSFFTSSEASAQTNVMQPA